MKKHFSIITILIFFTSCTILLAQSVSLLQNVDNRTALLLDGQWQTIVDPLENGYYNYRYQPLENGYFKNQKMTSPSDLIEYDFDTDTSLDVPGDWNTQAERLYYYEGTVWYKKSFNWQPSMDKRYFLHFGAAHYQAKVYVNGNYVGAHEGGYTPFQFDVTEQLIAGKNFVVVKVDNKRFREAVPTVNTDWWNYGGLTRSVRLVTVPRQYIQDYFIQLDPENPNTITGWIQLTPSTSEQEVEIQIPELNKKIKLQTNLQGKASFSFPASPELWTPEQPKRYAIIIASATDQIRDRIGFRTVETHGHQIFLNGKPLFLKGISIHEEAPYRTGRATNTKDSQTLLKWAKELGCNYIRLAHYPHNQSMVEEAEKMGLLIWSEIPVYWTVLFDNPDTYRNAENQLEEMISRDKNRAAVILWSVANETPVSEARTSFLRKLVAKARSLDRTRLITAALETHNSEKGFRMIDDPLGADVDVIGINYYCGWYTGTPKSCGNISWKTNYNKPVVMSEFGGGALQGYHGPPEQRWTEEYQDVVYKNNIKMLKKIPFLAGTSPWILMDFRSARRHLKTIQMDFNRKGLISEKGIKKQAFYTLQRFYTDLE
tara:strand:+ start:10087 stop:11886 length:1800 start_codon:yes stop_codon:yes gene_type:complete